MDGMIIDEKTAGLALAGVFTIWYAACIIAFYLIPDATLGVGKYLFHGLVLNTQPVNLSGATVGLVLWAAIAFSSGAGFARLYNQLSR